MVFDRTENEPEEWDPEEELYDPDSDGLTIPQVSTGEESADGDGSSSAVDGPELSAVETDVPPDLLKIFWALVLVVNAAVLVTSLGLLLLLFEGVTTRNAALVVAGLVLFGMAGRRYRKFRADESDVAADGSDTATDDGSGPGPAAETAETTSGEVHEQGTPSRDDRS